MDKKVEESKPIILHKSIIDLLLKEEKPAELIALYTFYYYTARWQKTNQIKATTAFVSKGLHLSEKKVREYKKILINLGLIKDIQKKNSKGRYKGWYIKVNYIWSDQTVKNPQCGLDYSAENEPPNALSTSKENALSSITKITAKTKSSPLLQGEEYDNRLRKLLPIITDKKIAREIAVNPDYETDYLLECCNLVEKNFDGDIRYDLFQKLINDRSLYERYSSMIQSEYQFPELN